MIGDRIVPKPWQTRAAERIFDILRPDVDSERHVIAISGESGAGKSEIAVELSRLFEAKGKPVFIFQQDDYFYYPPKTNAEMRRKNIKHVGLGEVDLKRLDSDVGTFRLEKSERITKPVVIFAEDRITRETIDPNQFKVGIVEGTYAALLNQVTRRIFIARTYEDTRQDRHARRREKQDHFIEMVLEIEHGIISRHLSMADIIVERDHSVRVVTKETQTE